MQLNWVGRFRRARGLVSGLALVLVVAACGSGANEQTGGAGSTSGGQGTATGTLIVGTDPTHPPHDFLDDKGNIVGWEYDFIQEVGKKLNRKVEYKAASFDALLPGLSSGRFDLVFANMGITPERLKVVDMVTAFAGGQAFLGRADRGLSLPDLSHLCGISVGVTRGSTQADLAAAQSKKCTESGKAPVAIQLFQSGDQIILAVESRRVDTYWTAQPIAQYYATQPGSTLAVVGEVPGTRGLSAIALPKGSQLTDPVHKAVQALIDDGTYMKVLKKWHLESNAIQVSEVNPAPKPATTTSSSPSPTST